MRTYEKVFGTGNDVIAPSDGFSIYVVDGGEGSDTFFVDASSRKFSISEIDNNGYTTISGASGTEVRLKNVETLVFKDGRRYTLETVPSNPDAADLQTKETILLSPTQEVTTQGSTDEVHTLDVIVDVLGQVVLLRGLTEKISATGHTLEYAGVTFKYSEIDPILTTVIRDNKFTEEFSQEIADAYPAVAGISYETVLALVGSTGINDVLLLVAGVDGNFIG